MTQTATTKPTDKELLAEAQAQVRLLQADIATLEEALADEKKRTSELSDMFQLEQYEAGQMREQIIKLKVRLFDYMEEERLEQAHRERMQPEA